MRRRFLALGAVLGCLGLSAPTGCAKDRERGIRAPKSGVKLHYALEVGTSLDGHLRIGTTRQLEGIADPLTQSLECDARLFVVRAEPDGSRVVRATFRNVDLDWSVPPETGLSSEAFAKLAATTLKETELRFSLSPRGKLVKLPVGPDRSPPELEGLLDTLGRAAAMAFVEVPAQTVGPGKTWVDTPAAEGGPRNEARFEGLARRGKSGPALAKLWVHFTTQVGVETDSGPRRRQIDGETTLRLSERGIPTEFHAEYRDFDPVHGTAVQQVHGTWNRTDTGDRGTTDVQDIEDPCDPDYVGTATCPNPT